MNSSFLYHAWGLYSLECTKEEYKGNKIILHVQSKKRLSVCPKCGKSHLVKNGYRFRDYIGLPIGGKKVIIRMKVQRYKCKNEECDFDQQHKTRLDNALAMNEPLSKAYYLKEQLREIWSQISKEEAEAVLDDWVKQARESKIPQLMRMAATLLAHRRGIQAWYDSRISTGKVEGINNKIKVMKRNAYGFRDDRYFTLWLYALHDCRITRNVG